MMNDSVSEQEPRWPEVEPKQVLQVVEESCQQVAWPQNKRAGRPAKVSWSHLCLGILLCFVRGWNAQLEVWRLIGSERLGDFAPVKVSDQAIYNRIERAGTSLQWVFEQVSAWLRMRQHGWEDRLLAPWASSVYAVDASTLDRLGRFLPWLREVAVGDKAGLGGQISALFDLRRQQWVRVDFWQDAKDNCKDHFLTLVEEVNAGALLLFDRGYLSFVLFDALTARGIWWISRYANKVTYEISHVCYQGDGVLDAIVYLGTHRADQAKYPVRLIQFWLHGRHYRYLTNVLDPRVLSVADVVGLYARRWDIELAFRVLKDHLDLHHLWSAKWSVVQVQLWCCLILAQVYHALQVEIARQSGVDVFDVSLDLLVRLTPGWVARGLTPLEHAVHFGRDLGLIRPSTRHRIEVPWIDPSWVVPPPPEAVQPRAKARYSHANAARGPRPKKAAHTPSHRQKINLLE
jgi:DDE family transposase